MERHKSHNNNSSSNNTKASFFIKYTFLYEIDLEEHNLIDMWTFKTPIRDL